jgi:SAM-dependent methyltransferase
MPRTDVLVEQVFANPLTGTALTLAPDRHSLVDEEMSIAFPWNGSVADLQTPGRPRWGETSTDGVTSMPGHHVSNFEDIAAAAVDSYDFDSLAPIVKSGHYRRIDVLDELLQELAPFEVTADFGTGPWGAACIAPRLREAALTIGFDVSAEALREATERTEPVEGNDVVFATSDGDAIGLQDGIVDVFFGGEVVEHVREPRVFLQEAARVLRPGGHLLLSTPNRDGIAYRAAGFDFTIGPEHIALMSYQELVSVLELYFDIVRIIGYELSIAPGVDAGVADDALLRRMQQRAADYPDLATGLIVLARRSEERFAANRRRFQRVEGTWDCPEVSILGRATAVPMVASATGASMSEGSAATVEAWASKLILLFWAHPWSGRVRVESERQPAVDLDLYSPDGGFRRMELGSLDDEATLHRVRIVPLGTSSPASSGAEVIFHRYIAYAAATG